MTRNTAREIAAHLSYELSFTDKTVEELLQEPVEGKRLIITDGVFSMDGDLAPLPKMADLADQYNALLVVDDAHGDGVMGPAGRGTVDHFGLRDRIILSLIHI